MTRGELSTILYNLNVPPTIYRLDGTHFELARVLDQRDDRWVVFLSERGTESSLTEFTNENQACVYFLGLVCLDLVDRNQLQVTP